MKSSRQILEDFSFLNRYNFYMNVLLINGSPRKEGNTKQALQVMETIFEQAGLNPIHIQLGGINISGCKACSTC
ncbi:hypothetical protein FACS1894218_2710 [Bacilli bacterium]|nr:hypothetical protein FACS1894218_2710 [Bacilli bacterium]